MEVEYKFQVDYAKSNRSTCMKCKDNIGQGTLRVARLVQAPNFDGVIPRWFHFNCFFGGKSAIQSTSEIKHFDSIKFEDQEKIRARINNSAVDSKPSLPKHTIKLSVDGLKCFLCKNVLIQERHMIHEGDKKSTIFYHLSCFLKGSNCPSDLTTLTGYKSLSSVDQQAIQIAHSELSKENRKRSAESTKNEPKGKKLKSEEGENGDAQKKALRMQSDRLWKMRNQLEDQVSKDALIGLLEYNEQSVPTGLSNLLDAVSDAMIFGALPTCPSCKNGPLRYYNGQYECSAMATEWLKCLYRTRDVDRLPFQVPKEYFDVDFLANYKYVKRTRIFAPDSVVTLGPLDGYNFFVTSGPFESGKSKKAIANALVSLGATVVQKVDTNVIVLSTKHELDKLPPTTPARETALTTARRLGILVVDEQILDDIDPKTMTKDSEELQKVLAKHKISDWLDYVGALKLRCPANTKQEDRKIYETNVQDVVRMTVKDGAVVDPQSGLEQKATVMKDGKGRLMSVVLGMVDLVKGYNSFYKLQALKSDKKAKFWLFRSWGRIGTTIGGTKLESFSNPHDVIAAFKELYLEKTGNEWKNRDNFQKKPYKFYQMDLDYDNPSSALELNKTSNIPSKLHPALQSLIEFICDVKSMEKAMLEFELDLKKMPLGKLSKKQIHEAYGILNVLSQLLDKSKQSKPIDQVTLLSESTRFYTLIPHDFGLKTPPLLDNRELIQTKLRMLEDLLEIELAYNLLRGSSGGASKNPIDSHYEQLKTKLDVLDSESDEYKRILDYVKSTHGSTHSSYRLEVINVFEVNRDNESDQFDQFKPQHNKQLLWHGSRRTNWMGILSQGLRIAPPEAPVTGYMFGKGVYFADMVSKSANYCYASQSQSEGILLLCEVILGDMEECFHAYTGELPKNKHSRKGMGRTIPDPSTYFVNQDGVTYPIGKPISSDIQNTSLLYNEYIVYNVAQIKQKYLVRVKFDYV